LQKRVYFQQFIEGESCAALYLGDGCQAQLLGVTRQLVGVPWLHARPFAYCGSIGPLPLPAALRADLERLGNTLARNAGLCGLFGLDFILRDGAAWPVEVNPRYTASVEVLEYGVGIAALGLHRQQFTSEPWGGGGVSPLIFHQSGGLRPPLAEPASYLGKAILFARTGLEFPKDGPWKATLESLRSLPAGQAVEQPPTFADIPGAGQGIRAGQPVLTLFARAASVACCLEELRKIAADLDRRLEKT
jgi:predicted ATP-grasp superfamily ATP-dependent carboligase